MSDSTLTIALQVVLDALHEPAISKVSTGFGNGVVRRGGYLFI